MNHNLTLTVTYRRSVVGAYATDWTEDGDEAWIRSFCGTSLCGTSLVDQDAFVHYFNAVLPSSQKEFDDIVNEFKVGVRYK